MIIGFTGKKQVGKSTACAYIESKYPSKRINFKDALVRELKQNFRPLLDEIRDGYDFIQPMLHDCDDEDYTNQLFVEKPPLVRKLMQCYGTEVRRGDDPNYWIKQWKEAVLREKVSTFVLCDDVRFENEAQAIWDVGGVVIQLERGDMKHEDGHVSETEMDSIIPDYTIGCVAGEHEFLYSELEKVIHTFRVVK